MPEIATESPEIIRLRQLLNETSNESVRRGLEVARLQAQVEAMQAVCEAARAVTQQRPHSAPVKFFDASHSLLVALAQLDAARA